MIICNNLDTTTYCIEKNINYLEIGQLIDVERFNKIDLNEVFAKWEKSIGFSPEGHVLSRKYQYVFKYTISHVLRTLFLADMIYESITEKLDVDQFHLFNYDLSHPYSRANMDMLVRAVLQIKILGKLQLNSKNRIRYKLKELQFKLLGVLIVPFSLLEYLYYFLRAPDLFGKGQLDNGKKDKPRILFFSGGRDFRFHSKLSKGIKDYTKISFLGKSIFNDKDVPENKFDLMLKLQPKLLLGYLRNRHKVPYFTNLKSLKVLFSSCLKHTTLDMEQHLDYISQFMVFRIKRDTCFIRSVCGIIDTYKADVVYSSSLPTPLISGEICGKVTISEFEGIGVEMNPMAPYVGRYISSPGPMSTDQIKLYRGGDGEVLEIGAYYY